MRPIYAAVTAMACAVVTVFAAPAFAVSDNTAQLSLNPSFIGGAGAYSELNVAPGPQTAGGATTGGSNTLMDGSVFADYGLITNFVSAYGSGGAVSRGIFRDTVTISSPGVATGTLGKLTYGIYVNGLLQANSGSTYAAWHLQTDLGGGASDINRSATLFAPTFPNGYVGDPLGTTYFGTIDFQFGMPMELYVQMEVSVNVANLALAGGGLEPGSATANFLNSLHWQGLSNVTLNTNPVSFSVASTSGTNWAAAVPEPASLAVIGIALIGMCRRPRRR